MKFCNLSLKKIKQVSVLLVTCAFFSSITQSSTQAIDNSNIKLPDSPCAFSGDFIQTKTIAGLDKNLISNGSFYYHCQDGVIWSTLSPINETLIFSRTGNNIQIKEQEVSNLKGRQSKLLGKLLNTMMSGNQSEIMQQFSINAVDTTNSQFELLPKKKSLKRAIKQIQLIFTKTNNNELEPELNKINIQIRDRKNQLTSIESTQTNTFDSTNINSAKIRHGHCLTSGITNLACNQLYPQPE